LCKYADSWKTKASWDNKNLIYKLAQDQFDRAIEVSQNFNKGCAENGIEISKNFVPYELYTAYYNKAFTLIELEQGDYKNEAKKCLEKAGLILQDILMPQVISKQINKTLCGIADYNSDFIKQIENERNIYTSVFESIQNSVQVINRSEKLIDILPKSKQQNIQEAATTQLQKKVALETLDKLKSNDEYTLQFRHLCVSDDTFKNYQTLSIIDESLKKYPNLKPKIIFANQNAESATELLPTFRKEIQKKREQELEANQTPTTTQKMS
jgi:hypothetical protein